MKKINKLVWLFISIVFAMGAFVVGSRYEKKQTSMLGETSKVETKEPKSKMESKSDSKTKQDLTSLYSDQKKGFLENDVTKQKINSFEKSAKSEEEQKMMKDLNKRLNIQTKFNELFVEPVLVGETFKKDVQLKKGPDSVEAKEKLVKDVKEVKEKDAFYEGILEHLGSNEEQDFSDYSASGEVAQETINRIILGGQVQSDFTLDDYYAAKSAVDSLPQGSEKESLMSQIEQIQTALTNMGIVY